MHIFVHRLCNGLVDTQILHKEKNSDLNVDLKRLPHVRCSLLQSNFGSRQM